MGKKKSFKFDEEGDAVEVVDVPEVSDVPAENTEKKGYRLTIHGTNIKKEKKKGIKDQFFMSYDDGLKMIKKLAKKGKTRQLVHKKMARHVSLPYHMSGKTAMEEAQTWIAQNTVGKYRKEYKGIVVAVGDVELASEPRVIADQYAFHTDVFINQIVFIPKVGDQYEAKVKFVQESLMVAVVMDMITIHVKQNDTTYEDEVANNDKILVKYTGIRIKNSLCHLRGEYVKMVEKAEIVEEVAEEEEQEVEDVKEEVKEEVDEEMEEE